MDVCMGRGCGWRGEGRWGRTKDSMEAYDVSGICKEGVTEYVGLRMNEV